MASNTQSMERHFKKGDVIYKKGEYAQEMCVINFGRVAVYAHPEWYESHEKIYQSVARMVAQRD